MKHQLVILGDAALASRVAALRSEVEEVFELLGLSPAKDHLEFLEHPDERNIHWNLMPVFVWYGESPARVTDSDRKLVEQAIYKHLPVLPLVETLNRFTSSTPSALHPINGLTWDSLRPIAHHVAQVVGLTQSHRRIFISYKRSESTGVATQLFTALGLKGYAPFLDFASVEGGVDFQQSLWHQLADVDLLIFLDSPNAIGSDWVQAELAQAHAIGISVLQVVWPGKTPVEGSDFCARVELTAADMTLPAADPAARLPDGIVDAIIEDAERARTRSIREKRNRVLSRLALALADANRTYRIAATGETEVLAGASGSIAARIYPFHGVPDAVWIHETEQRCERCESAAETRSAIAYNGLGIHDRWFGHLDWLNRKQCLETVPHHRILDWLGSLT